MLRRFIVLAFAAAWLCPCVSAVGEQKTFRLPGLVHSTVFSPDGVLLAVGGTAPSEEPGGLEDGLVTLWNVKSGQEVARLRQSGRRKFASGSSNVSNFVQSLAFSPDGSKLATADQRGVRVWGVQAKEELGRFESKPGVGGGGIAVSPDGKFLAYAAGSSLVLVRLEQMQEDASLDSESGQLNGVAFAPDGRTAAGASLGNRILVWDLKTRERRDVQVYGVVREVVFSPDGSFLVSAGEAGATIWRVMLDDPEAPLVEHNKLALDPRAVPSAIAFSPDGKLLAMASTDLRFPEPRRSLTLWNPRTGEREASVSGPFDVLAFSPQGKLLAAAGRQGDAGVVRMFVLAELLAR